MKIQTVKTSSLKPHPKNPNRHPQEQLVELQKSLDQFDQVKNIVVWKGLVIAGNGLLVAAIKQGRKKIEIQDVSDWSEEKAIKFMIADNRLPELGVMDDDMLSEMLRELKDPLDIPGIDEDFMDSLIVSPDKIEQIDSDNNNIIIRLEIIPHTWAKHSEDILNKIKEMAAQYKGFKSQVKE